MKNISTQYIEGISALNPCDAQTVYELLLSRLNARASVADIGCGRGDTLAYLSARTSFELFGAEPDEGLLAAARERCPGAGIVRASAQALPFTGGSFDAVLMECVFSLTEEPETAAKEAHRVLRGSGICLVTDVYCTGKQSHYIGQSDLLRNIYTKASIEAYFTQQTFTLDYFTDRTHDLQTMLAKMIMDDTTENCLGQETMHLLRRIKARYGIWIFRKI